MSGPFDLAGRVAVVTGANTGIGRGIAVALAQAGADVALVGRSPAADTAAEVMATGRRAAPRRSGSLAGSTSWSTTPGSFAAPTRSISPRPTGTR